MTADVSPENEAIVAASLDEPRVDSVTETLGRIMLPSIALAYVGLLGVMFFVVGKEVSDPSFDPLQSGKSLREFIAQQFRASSEDLLSTFLSVSAALLGMIVTAYVALVLSQRDRILDNRRLFSLAAVILTGLWVPSVFVAFFWLIYGGEGIIAGFLVPLCLGVLWFAVGLGRFGRATKKEEIDFAKIRLRRAEAQKEHASDVLRITNASGGGMPFVVWWRVEYKEALKQKCVRGVKAGFATIIVLAFLSFLYTVVLVVAQAFDLKEDLKNLPAFILILTVFALLCFGIGAGSKYAASEANIGFLERQRRGSFRVGLAVFIYFSVTLSFPVLVQLWFFLAQGREIDGAFWALVCFPVALGSVVFGGEIRVFLRTRIMKDVSVHRRLQGLQERLSPRVRPVCRMLKASLLPTVTDWRYRICVRRVARAESSLVRAANQVE